jgi:hypothetical protein
VGVYAVTRGTSHCDQSLAFLSRHFDEVIIENEALKASIEHLTLNFFRSDLMFVAALIFGVMKMDTINYH